MNATAASRSAPPNALRNATLLAAPLLALPVFVWGSLAVYSPTQRLLAWLMFVMGIAPGLAFLRRPKGVPLIAMVGLQYAIGFGLPVFFESDLQLTGGVTIEPSPRAITLALVCALLAFGYILLGDGLARRVIRLRSPIISRDPSGTRLFWYGVVVTGGAIALGYLGVGSIVAFMGPLEVVLPRTLGLSVLACVYFGGEPSWRQRLVIIALFVAATIWGVLGSMTQLVLEPLIIWAVARWVLRGRTPIGLGVAAVVLAMLLQPIKGFYRQFMGSGARTFSAMEAITTYAAIGREYWSSVGQSGSVLLQGRTSAAQRVSMLNSTARYIDLTPNDIGYKGPRTLLYPVYALMPRAFWPDKPSAQAANKILPVEYGIQSASGVATTMFGVGHVAEVFTALGLAAIMPVFFLLGVLYAVPRIALERGRPPALAATAVLLWMAVNLMWIGSTVGTAFGGLLQQLIVQSILFRALLVGDDRVSNTDSRALTHSGT